MKKNREIAVLIGRGEHCKCSDCPVLYGGECPYDLQFEVSELIVDMRISAGLTQEKLAKRAKTK